MDPKNASYLNLLAWLLVDCPDTGSRDPGRALPLATKAVQLAPRDGNAWIAMGVAQYRAGDWKPARESLEKAMSLRNGGDCADWFFLAMVHWKLGDKVEAPGGTTRPTCGWRPTNILAGRRSAAKPRS